MTVQVDVNLAFLKPSCDQNWVIPQIFPVGILQMPKGWSSWEQTEINVLIWPGRLQTLQLDDLLEDLEAQEPWLILVKTRR